VAFRTDAMLLDTFVEEVAFEFRQMAILVDMLDEEGDECEACGEICDPEDTFCGSCGTKLPEAEGPAADPEKTVEVVVPAVKPS
jgi:hypothetical protein